MKKKGYTKTIICLANSRRLSGWCIAGKEVTKNGFGSWLRPVSERETEEISLAECKFENGEYPRVRDIITIPFLEPKPSGFQTENHLIDNTIKWKKEGVANWKDMNQLCDNVKDTLWINNYSSSYGYNDNVPEEKTKNLKGSLFLFSPEEFGLTWGNEFKRNKLKVRADFLLNNHRYRLAVTDPEIEKAVRKYDFNQCDLSDYETYICVSLAKPFEKNNNCYKLVASVITKKTINNILETELP